VTVKNRLDGLHNEISSTHSMVIAIKTSASDGIRDRLDKLEIAVKKVAFEATSGSTNELASRLKRHVKDLSAKTTDKFEEMEIEIGQLKSSITRLSQNVSQKVRKLVFPF
jgi:predicted  nucleic acid-binding Zn-ribbon protein